MMERRMHPNDPSYQKPVFSEPKMFYVRKDLKSGLYEDEDGELAEFNNAEKYSPSMFTMLKDRDSFKSNKIIWVGPCEE